MDDVATVIARSNAVCAAVIVERLTLVRRVIRRSLEREPGLTIVGEAANLEEATSVIQRTRPSIVLLGAPIPGHRAADAVRRLQICSDAAIILIAGGPNGSEILRAIEAGARGCLTYGASLEDIANALREVHAGGTALDRVGTTLLFEQMSRRRTAAEDPSAVLKRLTAKEKTVLALLAQGASRDEIAGDLGISRETVRTHAQRLLAKLGVHSRLEAVAYINQHDLLPELLDR